MTYQGWYKPSRFPTKFPSKRDHIKTYSHTLNAVLTTTTIQQESKYPSYLISISFFWRVSGWFSTARTSGEQRLGACCSWLLQACGRLSGGISWPSSRENVKLAQKITCWVEWAAHHGFEGLAVRVLRCFEVVMTCPRASPTASPCFSIVKELGFLQHKCLKSMGWDSHLAPVGMIQVLSTLLIFGWGSIGVI